SARAGRRSGSRPPVMRSHLLQALAALGPRGADEFFHPCHGTCGCYRLQRETGFLACLQSQNIALTAREQSASPATPCLAPIRTCSAIPGVSLDGLAADRARSRPRFSAPAPDRVLRRLLRHSTRR